MFKALLTSILIALLSSCSLLEITDLNPGDETVRLYYKDHILADCKFIDEVIGSQGRWYNYIFISNEALTRGAINDLKSKAKIIGANSVHIYENMSFSTSVTILGQAFKCP